MKSYIFFIVIFIIIFIMYKFYTVIFSKVQYVMGFIVFGFGVLAIISPIVMNNLDNINNFNDLKSLLQKKYKCKV